MSKIKRLNINHNQFSMDNHDLQIHPTYGFLFLLGSFICGIVSWLSRENIDLKNVAAAFSIIGAVFAIRYYYYATKVINGKNKKPPK